MRVAKKLVNSLDHSFATYQQPMPNHTNHAEIQLIPRTGSARAFDDIMPESLLNATMLPVKVIPLMKTVR